MTTEEKNRLIAEFEGWELIKGESIVCPSCDEGKVPSGWCICHLKDDKLIKDDYVRNPRALEYRSSWSWLMPVVEKISKIPLIGAEDHQDVCYPRTFGMPHTDGTVMFRFNGFSLHYGNTLIEAAYAAVVEVVEYINNQQPIQP